MHTSTKPTQRTNLFERLFNNDRGHETAAKLEAAANSMAMIEFDLGGNILFANEHFLSAMGYALHELEGQHHRMFVDREFANSSEYRDFWARLNRGETFTGEFRRLGKDGKEVWIEASYTPITDSQGKLCKVVKFATVITERIEQREQAFKLRRIIEDSDAAFMMVDRDFIVTYVNQATVNLLSKHADILRSVWPNFDVTKMVGSCIGPVPS